MSYKQVWTCDGCELPINVYDGIPVQLTIYSRRPGDNALEMIRHYHSLLCLQRWVEIARKEEQGV